MSDLISRQAAIDALDKRFDSIPMEQTTEILLLRKDLRNLPSAQRTGRWIYNDEAYPGGNPYGHYECDQCGEYVPHKTNYCPNCGADMRGKQDG